MATQKAIGLVIHGGLKKYSNTFTFWYIEKKIFQIFCFNCFWRYFKSHKTNFFMAPFQALQGSVHECCDQKPWYDDLYRPYTWFVLVFASIKQFLTYFHFDDKRRQSRNHRTKSQRLTSKLPFTSLKSSNLCSFARPVLGSPYTLE